MATTQTTTTQTQTQTPNQKKEEIYSYDDGSVYMGQMVNNKKDGRGTLRTAAIVFGEMFPASSAEDNAHLVRWYEYIGEWSEDVMHGSGRHVMMRGDGTQKVLYDGIWHRGAQMCD